MLSTQTGVVLSALSAVFPSPCEAGPRNRLGGRSPPLYYGPLSQLADEAVHCDISVVVVSTPYHGVRTPPGDAFKGASDVLSIPGTQCPCISQEAMGLLS